MAQRYGLLWPSGRVTDIMLPTPANKTAIDARTEGVFASFNAEPAVLSAGGPFILNAGELELDVSGQAAALLKEQREEIAGLKMKGEGVRLADLDVAFNHLDFTEEDTDVTTRLAELVTETGG